jgi:uncharacterized protein YdeI (YjbR/CyaY-like superfamily)
MASKPELPIFQAADQGAWRRWLESNHATAAGVWLKLATKGSPTSTVTQPQAIEEALCFGWIDGQVRGHDEHFYLQRLTPRRSRSKWSQINTEKAARLIAEGRMHPPGMAEIEAAQRDGRWEAAYEPQSRATVPDDLQHALDRNPGAKAFFETLTGSTRYAFLYRLHHVGKAEARAERIEMYIERLSAGRTLED